MLKLTYPQRQEIYFSCFLALIKLPSMTRKKIAICHYRVGGTDGVSLEIAKRKQILEKYGCEVKLIAGNRSKRADYIIKELEWDDGIIPIIKENGFVYFKRKDLDNDELRKKMHNISRIIEGRLNSIHLKEKFDYALIHNIFSFGGHIAAARAFTKWIKEHKIKTIATHHDIYWERKEFSMPRNGYLRKYMHKYMPPKDSNIEHVVINSLAKRELKKRLNIEASVLPDVFDFNQPPWQIDSFNRDFLEQFSIKRNDLIILQATRVIPRKGIEISIDFTKALLQNIDQIVWKKLYNGKKLDSNSNIVLILAGYAEDEKREYLFKLKNKAFNEHIHAKFISGYVKANRSYYQGIKNYSLWDAYVHADLITFPSIWEGWGNQFVEAVFAKKPIVVFEYPVFKFDINKEGYNIISLGDGPVAEDSDGLHKIPQEDINQAVKKITNWLLDQNLDKKLEQNFQLGKKYHDFSVLEKFLVKKLNLE